VAVMRSNVPVQFLLGISVLLTVGLLAGAGRPADAASTNTLGTNQITNGTTMPPVTGSGGWCLDDKGGSTAAGTPIEIYQCNDNWSSQLWTVEQDGTVRVQDHCLDVQGGSTASGTPALLNTCNGSGSPGEQWQAQANGSLLNVHSGKCLGVSGGDPVSNDQVVFIWPCDGADTQVWHLPAAPTRGATAASRLQDMWNSSEALFDTSGDCTSVTAPGGNCWWWSANELNALIDFSWQERAATGSSTFPGSAQYLSDVSAAFNKYDPSPCTGNGSGNCTGLFTHDQYIDDAGWWGLMWMNAYELTGNANYLNLSENILDYMHTQGWDSICGGGVWQFTKPGAAKDAIANELYFELAARLYRETGNGTYLGYATASWNWIKSSVIVEVPENGHVTVATAADLANPDARLLVADGAASSRGTTTSTSLCPPEAGTQKWSYNQGVILGALNSMYQSTGNAAYLTPAEAIADTVEDDVQSTAGQAPGPYSNPALVDTAGILSEPCQPLLSPKQWPDDCDVSGSTGVNNAFLQFKGIFMRNLACLGQDVPGAPSYASFISANANAIYNDDQNLTTDFATGADLNLFGFLWDSVGSPWPGNETRELNEATQGSALDGLVANMGDSYAMC
jgi:predicted alpha-1,6-mannanase (GH76 family)